VPGAVADGPFPRTLIPRLPSLLDRGPLRRLHLAAGELADRIGAPKFRFGLAVECLADLLVIPLRVDPCDRLFDGAGALVCVREDVGRHNAMD
jgi:hypothetical protein